MDDARRRRQTWLVCLGLALAILAAYGQLWQAGFINYDDPGYVTANPYVKGGLTWPDFVWAWTKSHSDNWHPLTWLSHMLDVQLYGMNAGGHHLTSVALHVANSILLFLLLRRMTREMWPSALVAALFALHPLHVESVAWISERKDVLSTLFWILSIWFYVRWVEEERLAPAKDKRFYILSIILFALGLLAKPMLVTLPFALLLLDYWPLPRRAASLSRLFIEKIPFFILAAASCVVTFFAQRAGGAVVPLEARPLAARLANVPVAYVRYVMKIFWPGHLAIPYPEMALPGWSVAVAMAVLLLVTGWVLWRRRAQPWLTVGWFWFLGTLAPVIGVVQVGMQSIADRYTYIPGIGLFVAVVWAGRKWSLRLGPLILLACFVLTVRQAALWKNSGALFLHSTQMAAGNFVAYESLGTYEIEQGRTNAGIACLETAVRINPHFAFTRDDLGKIFMREGRTDDALAQFQAAVSNDSKWPQAHYDFGYALLDKGRVGEALDQFQMQVNLLPDDFKAQDNMGTVLLQQGLAGDAIPYLQKAAEINPDDAGARYLLGNSLFRQGRAPEAIGQYEKSIQLDPSEFQARNDLAWIRACNPDPSLRDGTKALELALRADQTSGGQNPVILGTLAAAYAEAGRFSDAVATDRRACQAALAQTNNALAQSLEKRLRVYQTGSPWRDPARR